MWNRLRVGGIGIVAVLLAGAVVIGMFAASMRRSPTPGPTPRTVVSAAATSRPMTTATPRPANTPRPTATPPPTQEPQSPVKVNGKGTLNSFPFDLKRGHYLVKWFAQGDTPVGCSHHIEMMAVSGKGRPETVANAMLKAEPQAGETHFYNVAAGQYYLRANSGCEWSVTLEPAAETSPSPRPR